MPTPPLDHSLALHFSAKREEARAMLLRHMEARGLFERDGWSIVETLRHRDGKTELVLRPIHLRLTAPEDLECVVAIDEPGTRITADCNA